MNEVPTTEVRGTLCCKRIYLNKHAVCPASICAMSLSLHLKSWASLLLESAFWRRTLKCAWFLVKTSSFYRCVQNWLQQISMRFVRTMRNVSSQVLRLAAKVLQCLCSARKLKKKGITRDHYRAEGKCTESGSVSCTRRQVVCIVQDTLTESAGFASFWGGPSARNVDISWLSSSNESVPSDDSVTLNTGADEVLQVLHQSPVKLGKT